MPLPRIIHVVNSVKHGGAERVVLELAAAQHGVIGECEVICLHTSGALVSEFANRGIPVTQLAPSPKGVLPVAWRLAGALRARQPRVVHAHNTAPLIAVALGRHLRPWGDSDTRLIYTEHGRLFDERPLIRWLRRSLIREYDAIIGVSNDVRELLMAGARKHPERVHMIMNGVDLARFSAPPSRASSVRQTILSVGRLAGIKGQDVLLDALALIKEQLRDVSVVIVGDGPTHDALLQQSRDLGLTDLVRFVGAQQDVRPFLSDASIFVLPSRSEGVSVALLEAMSSGLPVVATAVGGTPEVTGPGRGALLVPPEDPGAMAEALVTMLRNPALAAAEGKSGRRRVEEGFSLDLTVSAYAHHYGFQSNG